MTLFLPSLSFIAGGAFIWFCKDRVQALVIGGDALAAKLRTRALALETAASAVKAPL